MRLSAYLYLLYLLLPIVLLFIGSFGESWTNSLLPTGFTTNWYSQVFNDGSFIRAFKTSLFVTTLTCVLASICALPFCFAVYFSQRRRSKVWSKVVTVLPIATPELVLGFGFILAFNSELMPWLGSTWLLIVGITVISIPYLIYTLLTDLDASNLKLLDKSAQSLGAGLKERFFGIYLPLVRHSLLNGLITVAAIAIGEFQISNLISGFLNRPYPVVLLQAFYGATGFACAATIVLLSIACFFAVLNTLQNVLTMKKRRHA